MISIIIVAIAALAVIGLARGLGIYVMDFFLYRFGPVLAFLGGMYLMALLFGRI